jgi:hypothetical protein
VKRRTPKKSLLEALDPDPEGKVPTTPLPVWASRAEASQVEDNHVEISRAEDNHVEASQSEDGPGHHAVRATMPVT